jgi:hypothetical protein
MEGTEYPYKREEVLKPIPQFIAELTHLATKANRSLFIHLQP